MLKVEMALSLVIAPAADSGWPVVVEAAQRGYRRHTNWKALHVQRNAASVPNSVSATPRETVSRTVPLALLRFVLLVNSSHPPFSHCR